MDGIFDVEIIRISFLQKALCGVCSLSKGGGFPAVESARSFELEDLTSVLLIPSGHDHADTERSDSSALSILLEELGDLLAEHER